MYQKFINTTKHLHCYVLEYSYTIVLHAIVLNTEMQIILNEIRKLNFS